MIGTRRIANGSPAETAAAGRGASTALLLLSTAMLLLFYYFVRADTIGVMSVPRGWTPMTRAALPSAWHFVAAGLLLGVVPVVIGRGLAGLRFSDMGLGLGDWRRGLALVVAGAPVAVLAGRIASGSAAMRAVYPLDPGLTLEGLPAYALEAFLYFAAWEVLFRGVLLLGLAPYLGEGPSNGLQTALSVTAHFGRAVTETFSAFPAGLLFGWLALRLRSVWPIAILHWLVSMSMAFFIVAARG